MGSIVRPLRQGRPRQPLPPPLQPLQRPAPTPQHPLKNDPRVPVPTRAIFQSAKTAFNGCSTIGTCRTTLTRGWTGPGAPYSNISALMGDIVRPLRQVRQPPPPRQPLQPQPRPAPTPQHPLQNYPRVPVPTRAIFPSAKTASNGCSAIGTRRTTLTRGWTGPGAPYNNISALMGDIVRPLLVVGRCRPAPTPYPVILQ